MWSRKRKREEGEKGRRRGEEGGGAEQKLNKASDLCNKFILGT